MMQFVHEQANDAISPISQGIPGGKVGKVLSAVEETCGEAG